MGRFSQRPPKYNRPSGPENDCFFGGGPQWSFDNPYPPADTPRLYERLPLFRRRTACILKFPAKVAGKCAVMRRGFLLFLPSEVPSVSVECPAPEQFPPPSLLKFSLLPTLTFLFSALVFLRFFCKRPFLRSCVLLIRKRIEQKT